MKAAQESLMNPHNPSLAAVQPQDTPPARRAPFDRHETGSAASPRRDFNHVARFASRRPLVVDRQLGLEPESSTPAHAAHGLSSK